MSALLLFAIRCYWRFWPEGWQSRCLYRETCSRYVYRVARMQGLAAGVRALIARVRSCRPGYAVYSDGDTLHVRLADGSTLDERAAAAHLLAPHRRASAQFRPVTDEPPAWWQEDDMRPS